MDIWIKIYGYINIAELLQFWKTENHKEENSLILACTRITILIATHFHHRYISYSHIWHIYMSYMSYKLTWYMWFYMWYISYIIHIYVIYHMSYHTYYICHINGDKYRYNQCWKCVVVSTDILVQSYMRLPSFQSSELQ